ncbi:unnamed protein product [Lactuca saligna]|uniref:Uncharacterized protein n=1 Tax=Lactuca saligna TaxID=75948 RepID=A0AA35YL57_LACSI|nr:unnamed protein product [Lactuca saligna]
MATAHSLGRDHTTEEWESFQFRFGFVLEHGVQIRFPDASLYNPPEGKEYGFSVRELTPIAINKIMGFELLCRALGRLPTVPAFNYTRAKVYVDRAPTLFGADNDLDDALKKININGEDWLDFFLAASGMSAAWRLVGRCPSFSSRKKVLCFSDCMEEVVSLKKNLHGLFDGELQCRDVDLVETLPPHVSSRGIEATISSDIIVTGASEKDPDLQDIVVTGASQKDPTPSGFSIGLRVRYRRESVVDSLVFAPLFEGTSFKLCSVITYEDSGGAKIGQDILGHERYHLLASEVTSSSGLTFRKNINHTNYNQLPINQILLLKKNQLQVRRSASLSDKFTGIVPSYESFHLFKGTVFSSVSNLLVSSVLKKSTVNLSNGITLSDYWDYFGIMLLIVDPSLMAYSRIIHGNVPLLIQCLSSLNLLSPSVKSLIGVCPFSFQESRREKKLRNDDLTLIVDASTYSSRCYLHLCSIRKNINHTNCNQLPINQTLLLKRTNCRSAGIVPSYESFHLFKASLMAYSRIIHGNVPLLIQCLSSLNLLRQHTYTQQHQSLVHLSLSLFLLIVHIGWWCFILNSIFDE